MSSFFNCASAVIDNTAKAAFLPFISRRNMDNEPSCYIWLQHGQHNSSINMCQGLLLGIWGQHILRTSILFSAEPKDMDTIITLSGSTGQGHQNGLQDTIGHEYQYEPQSQPQPMYVNIVSVSSTDHWHNITPDFCTGHPNSAWSGVAAQPMDIDSISIAFRWQHPNDNRW